MTYETLKALKDAGFPQMGNGDALVLHDPHHFEETGDQTMARVSWERYVVLPKRMQNRFSEDVYCPTLEELIEACGRDFSVLIQNDETEQYKYLFAVEGFNGKYIASSKEDKSLFGEGATPSDAVANLYLALNTH